MGQRTQLFVTAETDPSAFGGARRHRIGRHHHWRYGPDMVICAAQVVEHLNTVPDARRHGVASALLAAALDEAHDRGCSHVVLEPSPAGAALYDALGLAAARTAVPREYYLPMVGTG